WSSEFYDSELDLVYYNFRHYSPALGRFLSRDPIAEQGGRNLYAFVQNTPTTHTDSLGLRLKTVVLKGGLGVWAGELSYEEMTDTCKPSISNLTVLKSNVDNPFTYVSLLVIDLVEVSIEQVINKELRPIKKELCFLPPSFVCRGSRQTVSYEVGIKYSIRWFSIPLEIPMLDISIGIPEEATYTKIISVTGRCCRDSI
ncbi:MAG: RHS repeat-associated core domain-containing protein, partial [Opitutales bacterium]|nr:RHS repeat-associated core domain-containing protein [Opitutales bacterium]